MDYCIVKLLASCRFLRTQTRSNAEIFQVITRNKVDGFNQKATNVVQEGSLPGTIQAGVIHIYPSVWYITHCIYKNTQTEISLMHPSGRYVLVFETGLYILEQVSNKDSLALHNLKTETDSHHQHLISVPLLFISLATFNL